MSVRTLGPADPARVRIFLISALLCVLTIAVVAAHSMGRLPLTRAAVILIAPVVVVGILLRPAWVVVFILAAPSTFLSFVPTRGFLLLGLLTLAGQLITRGKIHLDWRSGMYPALLLAVMGYFFKADVAAEVHNIGRGYLNLLTFWPLLALITYNAVRVKELDLRIVTTALLLGAGIEVGLATTGLSGSALIGGGEESPLAIRTGYVGAMGFSVSLGLYLLGDRVVGRRSKTLLIGLILLFGYATIVGFVRAAWVAALIYVLLLGSWAARRRLWLIIPAALLVIVALPIARERVVPGSTERGFQEALDAENITTGRTGLWSILWEHEIVPALPWGNGWAHSFSLTPEALFGFQDFQFDPDVNPFVFPHNDFLFWMVEFGLVGLAASIFLWVLLIRAFRRSTHGLDEGKRRSCYILAGVLVMMIIVQLIDNAFSIRAVSDRFFVVAGFIFGLAATPDRIDQPEFETDSM